MKKLSSIELLHANGDSTVIGSESIVDLQIGEIVQNWELNEELQLEKMFECQSFHLEIVYQENEEAKEVIEGLLSQTDLEGFILAYHKSDKVKIFDLPYLEESDDDSTNIFQVTYSIDVNDLVEGAAQGTRLLLIDIDVDNLEFEDEEFEDEELEEVKEG